MSVVSQGLWIIHHLMMDDPQPPTDNGHPRIPISLDVGGSPELKSLDTICALNILREKSLAIYFEDSQFRRNMTLNFIVSLIYVDERSRVR